MRTPFLLQAIFFISLTQDYDHFLIKVPNTDLHPGLILLNVEILLRRHFKHVVNDDVKRKASECMPLTNGNFRHLILTFGKKMLVNIRIGRNSHLYDQ